MNTEGQITVRQWFALPKAERRTRAEAFRAADEALQANGDAERAAGIREETEEYLRLNGRVNDLWPTIPWWVRAPALPHVAADITRILAALAARLFPGRGRHQQIPGPDDTVNLPRARDDDWPSAAEVTRLDLPPAMGPRPYLPGGEDDGEDRYRGWLP